MAFEEEFRQALERALTALRGHVDGDMRRFAHEVVRAAVEDRTRAATQAAEAAAADVRRQAEAQLSELRASAQKQIEELRRSSEAQVAELKRALEGLRAVTQAEVSDARRAAQAQVEETRGVAQAQIDEARRLAQMQIAEARRTGQAAVDEARRAAQTEVEAAEKRVSDIQRTTDAKLEEMRREVEAIRRTSEVEAEELVISQLESASGENDRKIAEAIERTRTDSHQSELAQAARLADAIRTLDEARSLGEALEALAQCAGREVDRAAVLVVKSDRLAGWRLVGFGPSAPAARSIDLDLDAAGLPGAVVRTGVAVSRPVVDPGQHDARQPALPPFAQDAGTRHALALPVLVGGGVVAVLYADAPRLDTPSAASRWPAILEVLARHASRSLEALTVQQAAGLSLPRPVARASHGSLPGPVEIVAGGGGEDAARRYARLLLSEIRMYHEPLVDAGRKSRDLLARLGGEIERARRLYEARVPADVTARADYFEQELVRTLADGDRSLLGNV